MQIALIAVYHMPLLAYPACHCATQIPGPELHNTMAVEHCLELAVAPHVLSLG